MNYASKSSQFRDQAMIAIHLLGPGRCHCRQKDVPYLDTDPLTLLNIPCPSRRRLHTGFALHNEVVLRSMLSP
jgi:hypothetical protein